MPSNPNSVLLAKDKSLFYLVFLSHTFSTASEALLQTSHHSSLHPTTHVNLSVLTTQQKCPHLPGFKEKPEHSTTS